MNTLPPHCSLSLTYYQIKRADIDEDGSISFIEFLALITPPPI